MKILRKILDYFKADKIVKAEYRNSIMTVELERGGTHEFTGSHTVWFELPLMKRCSTLDEARLSELYQYVNVFGNPYPTAHLKK